MVEFSTATKPTARKQHICDLCGRPIKVGEKYSRFAGKAEGEMFCAKNHLFCADVIAKYCQWAGENEYDIDSVNEWAEETAAETAGNLTGKMTIATNRFGAARLRVKRWKEARGDELVL